MRSSRWRSSTAVVAAPAPSRGHRVQSVDLTTVPAICCRWTPRTRSSSAARWSRRPPPTYAPPARSSSRRFRTCRSIRTVAPSTPPTRCTSGSPTATRRRPTPGRTTGSCAPETDGDIFASMLRGIHDDAVSDALDELLVGARVVGVMGGHAMERGTAAYAGAARLGRALARAGPHGGHRRRSRRDGGGQPRRLRGTLRRTDAGRRPGHPGQGALLPALHHRLGPGRLRRTRPLARTAAPRWASRPGSTATSRSNAFAPRIAKYFANATREDGLLARCNAGVVFLPGAAGTVQEIFDNATPNYYELARRSDAHGPGRPRRTGPRSCPPGRSCRRWRGTGRWSPVSPWLAGSSRLPTR